jgi:oxygen-dependent protoporphyrinogen oxidase
VIGQLSDPSKPIHIWGAGFAGLILAYFLSEKGHEIHLYEKSNRVGGKLKTSHTPFGPVEAAANAFYADEKMLSHFEQLGLKPVFSRKKLQRWIWREGTVKKPLSFFEIIRILLRSLQKMPAHKSSATVEEIFLPLLGPQKVKNLLSPALQGVYSADAHELHAHSVWPQLSGPIRSYLSFFHSLKKKAHSVSFVGGMQTYLDALEKNLRQKKHVHFYFNALESQFSLLPNTLICTEASSAASLLQVVWPEGAKKLQELPYRSLTSVTFFTEENILPLEGGFGVLFPQDSGFQARGLLINHSIFPQRLEGKAKGSYTFILEGLDEVAQRAKADWWKLCRCLKIKLFEGDGLCGTYIHPWAIGLPLYNSTRALILESLIHDPTRPRELVLFGNYTQGISLREMYHLAEKFSA